MARTVLDQLQEKEPDYAKRGLAYTSSRYEFSRAFLAPDIVHDVVVKFQGLNEQPEIINVYAYFLGALDQEAIRYATRWIRRRERQVDLKDDLTPSTEPTVLDEVYRREEKEEARRKVAHLFSVATPEEREVLALLENGLSTSEIAEQLGITDSAVRMRLHHLRKRFKRHEGREERSAKVVRRTRTTPVSVPSSLDLVPCAA